MAQVRYGLVAHPLRRGRRPVRRRHEDVPLERVGLPHRTRQGEDGRRIRVHAEDGHRILLLPRRGPGGRGPRSRQIRTEPARNRGLCQAKAGRDGHQAAVGHGQCLRQCPLYERRLDQPRLRHGGPRDAADQERHRRHHRAGR